MKQGHRTVSMIGGALLCSAAVSSWPAAAGEEVVYKAPPWLTQCTRDEKTREGDCSIWRSLASPELKSPAPNKLVFVINAVDDYAFVQTAPYAPASVAIGGNPAIPLKQCLASTFCMFEAGDVSELRRQLEGSPDMALVVRGKGGGQTVTYDLAGYPAAVSAAKQWLSQP